MTRRVVKLGGSTLTARDYVARVREWLSRQVPAQTIFVVGGGNAVREIAEEQLEEHFDDVHAHWRCIDVMRDNAERIHAQWSHTGWLDRLDTLSPVNGTAETWFLDPRVFMEDDARRRSPLPESWDISSDSIAARVAERFEADELVVLKSALPRDLRRLGKYVDPFFVTAARHLKAVRFVNLRTENFAETRWR